MSARPWTAGPWAKPYYNNYPGDSGWWVHNGLCGSSEFAICVTYEGNANAEADAKLISASPDLAEALIALLELGDEDDACERWIASECPSGDVDSLLEQWRVSRERRDFFDERKQAVADSRAALAKAGAL